MNSSGLYVQTCRILQLTRFYCVVCALSKIEIQNSSRDLGGDLFKEFEMEIDYKVRGSL